jgi:hypothetical protein
MALSEAYVKAHIQRWEQELNKPYYVHRQHWPRHLFHHAPIENAVGILSSGQLLSRNDSDAVRPLDVAAPGVIDASPRAHVFARLYFRPRTPTQYHIEGIRRAGECHYGDGTHVPILVMLVFSSDRVLQLPGVCFSSVNMQAGVIEGSDEAYFDHIPFDKVYHEGPTGGDGTIKRHRCAEVLVPSPMLLEHGLRWILCRSDAERATLLHKLGDQAQRWAPSILVSDDLRVFEKRFSFVETVSISNVGLTFGINPRSDHQPIAVEVSAWRADTGAAVINFSNQSMAARPPSASKWIVREPLAQGNYRVVVRLDGHLAYENTLSLDEAPF